MAKTTPPPPKPTLHELSTFQISIGQNNPRKHFDEQAMQELTESVKRYGILQPIVVRTTDADGFELVCGERRYRAALAAQLPAIPCIIHTLTDDEAFDLQITENLQRKDINPMEESDAFFQLTKRGKTTAAKIADMLGKNEKYVYDRLALQRCIPQVQELLRDGTLPITHGKQFARLTLDDQQGLYETVAAKKEGATLSDIKRHISSSFEANLANAPFNIQNPSLYEQAGACSTCSKRSGCNALLFDDVQSHDICFDKSCYDKKVELHVENVIAQLQAEGKTVYKVSNHYGADVDKGIIGSSVYSEVKPEDEDFDSCSAYGVIVMAAPWKQQKPGEVIKIALEHPLEDSEDEADSEDDTDTPTVTKRDHCEEFSRVLIKDIAGKFRSSYSSVSNAALVREHTIQKFYASMDNEMLEEAFEMLNWELVKDEDESIDHKATIAKAYDSMEYGRGYILDLALMLGHAKNNWWSRKDVEHLQHHFAAIGIDLPAIMDEYEQQNNHTF